jgi:hypothetical protein
MACSRSEGAVKDHKTQQGYESAHVSEDEWMREGERLLAEGWTLARAWGGDYFIVRVPPFRQTK